MSSVATIKAQHKRHGHQAKFTGKGGTKEEWAAWFEKMMPDFTVLEIKITG